MSEAVAFSYNYIELCIICIISLVVIEFIDYIDKLK